MISSCLTHRLLSDYNLLVYTTPARRRFWIMCSETHSMCFTAPSIRTDTRRGSCDPQWACRCTSFSFMSHRLSRRCHLSPCKESNRTYLRTTALLVWLQLNSFLSLCFFYTDGHIKVILESISDELIRSYTNHKLDLILISSLFCRNKGNFKSF